MITMDEINEVERALDVQHARKIAWRLMTRNVSDDRKAQIRIKLANMGTQGQIVSVVWEQKLNDEGLTQAAATEKARRGAAYRR